MGVPKRKTAVEADGFPIVQAETKAADTPGNGKAYILFPRQ